MPLKKKFAESRGFIDLTDNITASILTIFVTTLLILLVENDLERKGSIIYLT